MDVRLLVPQLGPQPGGIGRYVTQLQRGLLRHGVQAELAAFRYLPGASRRSVLMTVPIGVGGRSDGAVLHLTRIMGASMLLFRRLPRTVVTVHDLGALLCPEDRTSTTSLDRLLFWLSLAGMRRAHRIIAVSEFTKSNLVAALGYDPASVDAIHQGVNLDVFHPIQDARHRLAERFGVALPADATVVLYVGSELQRKGMPTLIAALATVKRAGFPIHWLKVGAPGSPAARAETRRLVAEHGLTADVTFLDHVPDSDLATVYSASNLYVQPSYWEGFGFPVLEAMACGVPVVSTDAASLPEITGDAARLVTARDPDALAKAMLDVLGSGGFARELVERGRRQAEMFSWERTAALTIESYQRLRPAFDAVSGVAHDQLV